MIRIIGPDWPSKRKLQEAVATTRGDLTVAWGTGAAGALNGQRRLDAVEQLAAFKAAGVACPDFTTDLRVARRWVTEGALVFGRRREHSQGTDIVGPRHKHWAKREYWVKVIPNVADEWRIHVFCGKSIARGKKVLVGEQWRKMPVRNRANGWHMVHTEKPTDAMRNVAKAAVAACGYDFGAVDLLVTQDGTIYALEVNRAPGLDDYTCGAYAAAISAVATARGTR